MKTVFKWMARILLGLAGLLLLGGVIIFIVSEQKLNQRYGIPDERLTVPTDAQSIANGKRLTFVRGCVDCHGEGMGGKAYLNDPAVGVIYASNLTSGQGGAAASFSDADFVRAIRHGVGPDGKTLLVMPAREFNSLSAGDLADIVAYLRSAPPVDGQHVPHQAGPLGRVMIASGAVPVLSAEPIDHSRPMVEQVEAKPSVEYGKYLTTTCIGCHGANLTGGPMPGAKPDDPQAANLTPSGDVAGWQAEDFIRAIRQGVRPDGSHLSEKMPWKYLGQSMSDTELQAIWMYLQSLDEVAANTN